MKSYKKRARARWETGKHAKESANSSERIYSKKELNDEMREVLEGDNFRYKGKSKKKLTAEQKIKKQLKWYESRLEYWERPNIQNRDSCFLRDNLISSYKDSVKKMTKQLEEIKKKKDEKEEKHI